MNWISPINAFRWRERCAFALLLFLSLLWGAAPGVDAADDFEGLVPAIRAANASGSGKVTLGGDITLTAALPPITGSVTIAGGGQSISGDDAYRIFDVNGGALTLSNVTLTQGNAGEGVGGAIRMRNGARLVIENSTLSHNQASDGGAIFADGGALSVVNSTFAKNCADSVKSALNPGGQGSEREERSVDQDGCVHVTYYHNSMDRIIDTGDGGAIALLNGAQASIDGSTFRENRATSGGAFASGSSGVRLTISSSSFDSNSVAGDGGAIFANFGSIRVASSSFARNAADSGGGAIRVGGGALDIANSTFSENQSRHGAGALAISGNASATITHATFKDNWSLYWDASAIKNQSGGRVALRNSILVGRGRGEDCAGGFDQNVGNLSPDGTCAVRSSDAVMLGELSGAPAYYSPLDRSPAIDAAVADYCPDSDQLGTPRPHGGGCDVGAIEATSAEAAPAPIVPPPACSLADQIIAANTDKAVDGCRAGNGADAIRLTRDILLFSRLPAITSDITIEGNGHTISGSRKFRIFDVDGGHLTVKNLTLTEGTSFSQPGGAIRLQNGGRAVVSDSTFVRNSADVGGAIAVEALFGRKASVTVSGSSFVRNRAGSTGGAINLNDGIARIENSSFSLNSAGQSGGAINLLNHPRLEAINSSFINNSASWGGGALAAENGANATLTHVTIYNHVNRGAGSAIHIFFTGYGVRSRVSMRNSMLSGSPNQKHCVGELTQNVGNLIVGGSCEPMLSADPMLAEASDGATFVSPLPGSPAIRAADPRFCPDTDQVGRPRALVGPCDIGAIEAVPVRQALAACAVTTTHALNFRDGPGGAKIGLVAEGATLAAAGRTPRWFEVEHEGETGWISADYVATEGDCG